MLGNFLFEMSYLTLALFSRKFKAPSKSPYSGSRLLKGLLLLPLPYELKQTSSTSLKVTFASLLIAKQLPIPVAEFEVYGKKTSSIAHGPFMIRERRKKIHHDILQSIGSTKFDIQTNFNILLPKLSIHISPPFPTSNRRTI